MSRQGDIRERLLAAIWCDDKADEDYAADRADLEKLLAVAESAREFGGRNVQPSPEWFALTEALAALDQDEG